MKRNKAGKRERKRRELEGERDRKFEKETMHVENGKRNRRGQREKMMEREGVKV